MCNEVKETLKCSFCGFESTPDDFELDKNGNGFWCEMCDGFTYYANKEIEKHKFTLILEDKAGSNTEYSAPQKSFNKRMSLLRYPGGKSKLINYIYSKMQTERMDTFVEPFAGGGSVGLSLLNAGAINNLILNDLDYGIYSLFSIIKDSPGLLISKVKGYEPTHTDYFKAQSIIKSDYNGCNMLEAAWSLLVVNRLAYSGIVKANPLGGRNGSIKDLLIRWNDKELCRRINEIHEMRDHITISNTSAFDLIEEMYWNPSTTIFIDPPYFKQGKSLYHCYFDKEQHIQLNVLLDNLYQGCPGADLIVTYDNDQFIEDLYLYPDIRKISRVYSI